MRQRGRQGHSSATKLLTDQTIPVKLIELKSTSAIEMGVNTALEASTPVSVMEIITALEVPTQLPSAAQGAVLKQVAEILQQPTLMELEGPGGGGS